MAWSDKKLLPVEVHSTVRVPVPEVDKGRGDARNILAIVLEVINKFKKLRLMLISKTFYFFR